MISSLSIPEGRQDDTSFLHSLRSCLSGLLLCSSSASSKHGNYFTYSITEQRLLYKRTRNLTSTTDLCCWCHSHYLKQYLKEKKLKDVIWVWATSPLNNSHPFRAHPGLDQWWHLPVRTGEIKWQEHHHTFRLIVWSHGSGDGEVELLSIQSWQFICQHQKLSEINLNQLAQ